jgi:quercetin 2,3-dioxygenase
MRSHEGSAARLPYSAGMDTSSSPAFISRQVERLVAGQPTSDGDGVRLTRVLTQNLQRRLDPFLMLDAFGSDSASDYIGGFPDHPHRGFETITYMLHGRMRHRDSAGNVGLLQPGSVQWMTAGKGVIHSEMPEQDEGRMEGFQLWLNLPAKDKLCTPWYRDIAPQELPVAHAPGLRIKLIAGQALGQQGLVQREATAPTYLDIAFDHGARLDQALPATHNALVYVYEGSLSVGGSEVPAQRMAILSNPGPQSGSPMNSDPSSRVMSGVSLSAANGPARALLIAGQPLNEPIAQYGPFVMNSTRELQQAVEDFQRGLLA